MALRAWYGRHLGIAVEDWGGFVFRWRGAHNEDGTGSTVWSILDAGSTNLAPSTSAFMINYRVRDLRALVATLRDEGCEVDDRVEESEFGVFGWVMDPEGNRIELWQPPAGQ